MERNRYLKHQRELVAGKSHRHRSCYTVYTKDLDTDKDTGEINLDKEESPYESVERVALYKVFANIR